jgi:hypothetical protein
MLNFGANRPQLSRELARGHAPDKGQSNLRAEQKNLCDAGMQCRDPPEIAVACRYTLGKSVV